MLWGYDYYQLFLPPKAGLIEQQPTWQYAAPGSAEDACSAENALLRDQVRDLQSQTMQLQAEIANLKARNQALQKAASANQ